MRCRTCNAPGICDSAQAAPVLNHQAFPSNVYGVQNPIQQSQLITAVGMHTGDVFSPICGVSS